MRRADRLFQIIQILRRGSGPVTAAMIAAEAEVSVRTIYRDIADLIGQRVPISGEAGFGYILADSFEMPPLTLTADEADAIALGAEWVANHPDRAVARAAQDALSKIRMSLPKTSGRLPDAPALGAKPALSKTDSLDTSQIRQALRQQCVLHFHYLSMAIEISERWVWPVFLGYDDNRCVLIAWCETRCAFRHFRVERMSEIEVLSRKILNSRIILLSEWRREWRQKTSEMTEQFDLKGM